MGEAAGSSKRCSCCRVVVLPVLLVLLVAAIIFFAKNKTHPSPIPGIPSVTPTPSTPVAPSLENGTYGAALSTSLVFLQIQKAGKLVNNMIPWRGDSALNDGKAAKLDLSKGLYDAGDHMKFGFPMAFTATVLSWTILEYRQELAGIGRLNMALDSLQWMTDFLSTAHSADNVLCIQVGDPKVDHLCWDRPETMTEDRPLLFINKTSPGSDVAAETAAALAAASIVFNSTNATYSSALLKHAQQLFNFADNYTGLYTVTFPGLASYYKSTDYHDELLWAAAWLYHATGDLKYLQYTTDNAQKFKGYGDPTYFSWDDKRAGTQVLLSRVHLLSGDSLPNDISRVLGNYRRTAESIMCVLVPGNLISATTRTKGGLLWIQDWNSLQHSVGSSFIATLYSNYLYATQKTQVSCNETRITADDIRKFAVSQANYILGSNPVNMSYLVGYGSVYPQQVHHRGASIPADQNPTCTDQTWLKSPEPNPYVAVGALVGGPDFDDTYKDVRENALQGEPTTTSSALFTGLLSGLASNYTVLKSFAEMQ